MKTGNEIIAEYMSCVHIVNGRFCYWIIDGRYASELHYHESIEWLYPVYIKLRRDLKEFIDKIFGQDFGPDVYYTAVNILNAIEHELLNGNIQDLHKEIVEGIKFLTENKKSS